MLKTINKNQSIGRKTYFLNEKNRMNKYITAIITEKETKQNKDTSAKSVIQDLKRSDFNGNQINFTYSRGYFFNSLKSPLTRNKYLSKDDEGIIL